MKKFIFILIASVLLPASAFAASYPAYIFYFTNLGDGGTQVIENELTDMGYEAIKIKDADAQSIIQAMKDSAVFSYVGHGNAGRLFCNGEGEISAKSTDDANIISLEQSFEKTGLSNIRFVYYGCCYSDSASKIYGRLTTKTNELGANAVLGFSGSVNDNVATVFEQKLFDYMQNGRPLNVAVDLAKAESYSSFKEKYGYSNVDTARIYGKAELTLIPAGFGS